MSIAVTTELNRRQVSVTMDVFLGPEVITERNYIQEDTRAACLTFSACDNRAQLWFDEPAQIDTLVAALMKLRDDFAAARPDPAVVPLFEPEFRLQTIRGPMRIAASTLEEAKRIAERDGHTLLPEEPATDELPIRLEPETRPLCQGCPNLLRTTEETAAGFCEECQAEHRKIAF